MARPRCDNCGRKIRRIAKGWNIDWLVGEIPSNCPYCGAKISLENIRQLKIYSILIMILYFISAIVIASIVLSVVSNIRPPMNIP